MRSREAEERGESHSESERVWGRVLDNSKEAEPVAMCEVYLKSKVLVQ